MIYAPKVLTETIHQIHFNKYQAEMDSSKDQKHIPLIPDMDTEHNLFATKKEIRVFMYLLSDFGIDPIAYPKKDDLLQSGLIKFPYETRVTDFQMMKYFRYSEIESYSIRDEIIIDALEGKRNIFKRQVDLGNPLGINFNKRIDEIEMPDKDMFSFVKSYFEARKEISPEKDARSLEDLTPYCKTEDIYHYQIRLYYESPLEQYFDLFSVFGFINKQIGNHLEFIVEND